MNPTEIEKKIETEYTVCNVVNPRIGDLGY